MSSSGGSSSRSSRRQHQLWPEHSPVNISVMEGGDRVGRSVWQTQTDQHHQPPSLNSIRSDSGMNSMEYWDYTVELECIGQTPGTSSLPHLCTTFPAEREFVFSPVLRFAPWVRLMTPTFTSGLFTHRGLGTGLSDLMINKGAAWGCSVTH